MKVDGITWHAVTVENNEAHAKTRQFYLDTMGLNLFVDMPGVAVFAMPNGSMIEIYTPETVPPYAYNGSLAFGFRVDDIEEASKIIEAAGGELLGEITRVEDLKYAYRHFKGLDGRVYGLNEQK